MNPEQWLSLKWNGGSTMSDRWLNQSKIIQRPLNVKFLLSLEDINLAPSPSFRIFFECKKEMFSTCPDR